MSAVIPRRQRLARAAHAAVEGRRQFAGADEYASLALAFPAMILQNGLAQATGFLLAKGARSDRSGKAQETAHIALLDDLARVLREAGSTEAGSGSALHEAIIQVDMQGCMRLTRDALDASGCLKRYVQGVLKAGREDGGDA